MHGRKIRTCCDDGGAAFLVRQLKCVLVNELGQRVEVRDALLPASIEV